MTPFAGCAAAARIPVDPSATRIRRVCAAVLVVAVGSLPAACRPSLPDGPAVLVDRQGFFASTRPLAASWHVGNGVGLLVPHGPGDVLRGRLDPAADSPTVLRDDGFAPHRLVTRASGRALSGEVREALATALERRAGALAPVAAEALRASGPRGLPAPEHAVALVPAAGPPRRGAPLAAWAPRALPFVWLRSVESGYRLASLLDRLAGRMLAARGDARDAATLRLTLHDLLLPTIWRANPSGQKGVGECGLVLGPALRRGRLAMAVIFRVLDPDLHDMETRAGIALESRPEHLWRPAADPFPERRVRRNIRRRVADVEIVATDRSLADALAAGVAEAHAEDADALAFLAGPGEGPGRRALAAVFPAGAVVQTDAALAERVAAGAAALLRAHWDDLPEPRPRAAEERVLGLRRAEVRTDAAGAFVRLEADSEARAAGWEEALAAPGGSGSRACAANRADLATLAVLDGVHADPVERSLVVLGYRPVCPSRGAYRVHPLTCGVTCAVHRSGTGRGDALEPLPWPVTKVTRRAADVTLRVAIDWRRRE